MASLPRLRRIDAKIGMAHKQVTTLKHIHHCFDNDSPDLQKHKAIKRNPSLPSHYPTICDFSSTPNLVKQHPFYPPAIAAATAAAPRDAEHYCIQCALQRIATNASIIQTMSSQSSILSPSTQVWDDNQHHRRQSSSESSNWSLAKDEKEIEGATLLELEEYECNEKPADPNFLSDSSLMCLSPGEMTPPNYYRINDFLSGRPGKKNDSTATLTTPLSGETITLRDWSRANLRILTRLLEDDPTVTTGYLRYTDHIYSFPNNFSLSALLAYDDMYRRAQAIEGFKWGTRMSLVYIHYQLGARHPGRITLDTKGICERFNLQLCTADEDHCPKKRRHCCLGCQRDFAGINCPFCLKDKAKRELALSNRHGVTSLAANRFSAKAAPVLISEL
ncbi:hypothetical protein BDF19DRAFT_413358 [Syncephalis fuscata]|nr:hypothetical protein BDF19DRAFT_413358 [Syncephalis fuscata]